MDGAHKLVGVRGDDREGANPFFAAGSLPVLPDTREREWFPILHGDGIGLLGHTGLARLPFKKIINRDEAAAVAIGVPETWKLCHCFCFGVYGLSPAILLFTPMRNEAPPKSVKCALARLRMLADDPVLLAGGCVVARHYVWGLDKARDLETKLVRRRFLSEAPAHAGEDNRENQKQKGPSARA